MSFLDFVSLLDKVLVQSKTTFIYSHDVWHIFQRNYCEEYFVVFPLELHYRLFSINENYLVLPAGACPFPLYHNCIIENHAIRI